MSDMADFSLEYQGYPEDAHWPAEAEEHTSELRYVKHIVKEGARYHVLWWDEKGRHCSEPKCEVNAP